MSWLYLDNFTTFRIGFGNHYYLESLRKTRRDYKRIVQLKQVVEFIENKEAFVRLIRMNKQSLYKTAWIYLRDEQDIADALQNTILSCYENIQRLREPKYFKTWLMRILINECKDILRQKNHAAELDDFAEGVHCEELNLCEWKQLLLCLDEESRKIVELYYFDEFSVKEISALLEMNSNTVSTKLSRARAKLKKVIRR